MEDQDPDQTDNGGQERRHQEVEDGSQGDHSAHLGVEARRARHEAGDDERESHQLDDPHEELPGVGYQEDGGLLQVEGAEEQTREKT